MAPPIDTHPRHDLVPLLASSVRLSVVAALAGPASVEYGRLRTYVGLAKANLSQHVTTLNAEGWIRRERVGRHVHLTLTDTGRAGYAQHLAALEAIVGRRT